jgi:hypothetical protein
VHENLGYLRQGFQHFRFYLVSKTVSFPRRQLTIHDDMKVHVETQADLSNVAFIEADDAALICGNGANL